MIYFWRVELNSDYIIDNGKTPVVKHLTSSLLSSHCYVTAIENDLRSSGQYMDVILMNFDTTGSNDHELFYIKFAF